jgi:hypothetical protein
VGEVTGGTADSGEMGEGEIGDAATGCARAGVDAAPLLAIALSDSPPPPPQATRVADAKTVSAGCVKRPDAREAS